MNFAKLAADEADHVISQVFAIARDAIRERRENAEWWWVYRTRRAAYARTKVAKRWWLWLARRSRAMMEANQATCCKIEEAMAHLPRRGIV